MTVAFTGLLGLLALHYAAWMLAYWTGFRRVAKRGDPSSSSGDLPSVTVIVPARNEEGTIGRCLEDLLACAYPRDRCEIVVVDDDSTDGTASVVDGYVRAEAAGRVRLIRPEAPRERTRAHKKRAIETGIAASSGEIILTTDADCRVPASWIRRMVDTFSPRTAFVSGPVLYETGASPGERLQALEFLGLIAVGAGAIGIGRPNMCNGASVAYRREVFERLGGYSGIDHVSSGDDELLMQKIARSIPRGVRFCADPRAAVRTAPVTDPRGFFEQRRRWASKGLHYPDPLLVAAIGGIFVFYVCLLGAACLALVVPGLALPTAAAFGVKMLADAPLMIAAGIHFGTPGLLRYLPLLELVHPPYVVLVGLAGLRGGYSWKGRTIDR